MHNFELTAAEVTYPLIPILIHMLAHSSGPTPELHVSLQFDRRFIRSSQIRLMQVECSSVRSSVQWPLVWKCWLVFHSRLLVFVYTTCNLCRFRSVQTLVVGRTGDQALMNSPFLTTTMTTALQNPTTSYFRDEYKR